jgi:hypothetical protein
MLLHTQEDSQGRQVNAGAHLFLKNEGEVELDSVALRVEYQPGTRHAKAFECRVRTADGDELLVQYVVRFPFFMTGVGYNHDEFGHGRAHAQSPVHVEDAVCAMLADRNAPPHWHIQEVAQICARWVEGARKGQPALSGTGVVEQLVLGPHRPSGFERFYDEARA